MIIFFDYCRNLFLSFIGLDNCQIVTLKSILLMFAVQFEINIW